MLLQGHNVQGESHTESHTRESQRALQHGEHMRVRWDRDAGSLIINVLTLIMIWQEDYGSTVLYLLSNRATEQS